MAVYSGTNLESVFPISSIYTIFYFELTKTFYTDGELHNFWEMVYVDKGEVTAVADRNEISLSAGQLIFHKPNEFHKIIANGCDAPNLSIVTFDCNSPYMSFFSGKTFKLDDIEKKYLSDILVAGSNAFEWKSSDNSNFHLERRNDAPIGEEQVLKATLELLLLRLFRIKSNMSYKSGINKAPNINSSDELSQNIISYLQNNLTKDITLSELSLHFNVSASKLKKVFSFQTGHSIIDYFINLRIKEAKRMIRETSLNFTQISELVGFSSIHHFSNTFKKKTGMTPTEYSVSLKCHGEISTN